MSIEDIANLASIEAPKNEALTNKGNLYNEVVQEK